MIKDGSRHCVFWRLRDSPQILDRLALQVRYGAFAHAFRRPVEHCCSYDRHGCDAVQNPPDEPGGVIGTNVARLCHKIFPGSSSTVHHALRTIFESKPDGMSQICQHLRLVGCLALLLPSDRRRNTL